MRHNQHYSGNEEKFVDARFNQVLVIFSNLFNRSALDDVENQLIMYFTADKSKSKKQKVFYDHEIINRNDGIKANEYRDREKVATEIILPLWEDLFKLKWVNTPTLDEIRNAALIKYSPIKELTEDQMQIISEIEAHTDKSFVINGDAGTGKTVLLTHLVAKLITDSPSRKIAVVVQRNWIKTASIIFNLYGFNAKSLVIGTSTTILNGKEEFDTIIVDESHKLSRLHGKQMNAFNAVYAKRDEFKYAENHLECLKMIGKQVILMYDVLQGIRPAHITRERFKYETKDFEQKHLKTQFRIRTPKGKDYDSEDYISGIKYLLYKDTGLLNSTNYKINFDRSLFNDSSQDAYFGIFEERPLEQLIHWIEEDRNYNNEHINRVLAGLVEPWKMTDGKDPNIMHWKEGQIERRWNSTQENWINSKDEDAEDQIGSVFAVQGIDLNKCGVLIGNDLLVDSEGKLYGKPENFHNVNGKFSKNDDSPENEKEFTLFVLNIYYVLLTRGIDGIRVGFWNNESFKNYMKETLEIL